MGIIRALKAHFRHEIRQKIIEVIDDEDVALPAQEVAKRVSLLDAMGMLKSAWRKVSSKTIQNCWVKAGISTVDHDSNEDGMKNEDFPPPPEGLSEKEFEEWVNIDADSMVAPQVDIEEKVEELAKAIQGQEDSAEATMEEQEEEDEEEIPPSASEMRRCLHRLTRGLQSIDFNRLEEFETLSEAISKDLHKKFPPKQTTIDRFFCKQ